MAVLWVMDRGLEKLLAQINDAAPGRSKVSDGGIGDAAHAAEQSEHNPEHPPPAGNPDNQVDARDFTQDPAHGADMAVVSEAIRVSRDVRVKYVIFNRRIFSGRKGPSPWVWRPYTGTADPHTGHMHVSVEDDTHDQVQDWQIGIDDMAVDAQSYHDLIFTVVGLANGSNPITIPQRPGSNTPARSIPNATATKLDLILAKLATLTGPTDLETLRVAVEGAITNQLPAIADAVLDEDHDRTAG